MECRQIAATGSIRCARCGGQILLADESALLGTQLGRYLLSEVIGVGGMGIVFAAEHLGLRRPVALKLLLPELGHADFLERFRREAQMLAELRHPNIVEIYDFDISEFGVPYYVMERLDGIPLSLAQLRHGRPLSLAEAQAILVPVARALDYAHARGVVHRDLKPENIFLTRQQQSLLVKLLDFGIAKKLGDEPLHERLTVTGTVMGTPLYLTPEQLLGESVVPATDQYAMALIAAELLTGRVVRQGQSITQILRQAMQQALPDDVLGSGLSAEARAALQRATRADPAQRFATVSALVAELRAPGAPEDLGWLSAQGFLAAGSEPLRSFAEATTPVALGNPAQTTQSLREAATLPALPQRRAMSIIATVLVLVLVLALGMGVLSWQWPEGDSEPAASTIASGLREDLRLALPPDAGSLIGISSAGAVLNTAGGVYVQQLEHDRPASRRNAADERVLAVDEQGRLLLQRGPSLSLSDPKGNVEETLFDLPAEARLLAAARGSDAFVYALGDQLLLHTLAGPARTLAHYPGRRMQSLKLGERNVLVVLGQPEEVQLLDRQDGRLLWSTPIRVGKLYDLAWSEDASQLAICGFSDQVEIFDLQTDSAPAQLGVRNACYAAQWLPAGPSLVVRSGDEIVVWSRSTQTRLDWPYPAGAPGSTLPTLRLHAGRLILAEPEAGLLFRFTLPGLRPAALNSDRYGELWDLEADAGTLYAAAASGSLWQFSAGGSRELRVHENGITDIVAGTAQIATASDDRTLAVWRKQDMAVTWRARGHSFLVNQMWLAPDESALWSSSSDGQLKRWRWPELEPAEQIDLRALTGMPDLALHALWLSHDQQEALVGSWNNRLLHLRRRDGQWQARAIPIASSGGYRMLGMPSLNAVAILGIQPTRIWLWDLANASLQAMPDFGLSLLALCAGSEEGRLFVAGEAHMMELSVRRDDRARLLAEAQIRTIENVGVIGAAAVDRSSKAWILGSSEGRLHRVPWAELRPRQPSDTEK